MKNVKSLIALLLAMLLVVSMAGCSNEQKEDAHYISWWISVGEDASFYEEYEDNPIVEYIEQTYTFNGKKVILDFMTAPPGSEQDDFSTLIGTGTYSDVMNMDMATSTVAELYEEGIARDLTELVPQHMPNLMAFLKENPQLEQYLYTYIDGEAKILSLRGFNDGLESSFQGFCYRRDWLVDYGKHPVTGEPFSGGYTDPNDYESWEDNVVFPSGGSEPIYISDWEWMFEIFTKAMEAEGITDGYCYSPYYPGSTGMGELTSGFGGGAPNWYYDGENIVNGLVSDNTRAYLQCMNNWYQKGWINPSFDELANDMFFAIDTAAVFQGKVGLWQGRMSTVGNQLDNGDEATSGIMVFGCRQPINDVYGGDAQKHKDPDMLYQFARYGNAVILTDKMTDEEVIAFLEYVDFLFSEEGSALANFGLTKEQYETTQNEFYTRMGLTEGAFRYIEVNGEQKVRPNIDTSGTDYNATILTRWCVKLGRPSDIDKGNDRYVQAAIDNWDYYENIASMPYKVTSSLTVEQNQQITKINAALSQFVNRAIPEMIKGNSYDVWSDSEWEGYCSNVKKYRADEITKIYQSVLDSFE